MPIQRGDQVRRIVARALDIALCLLKLGQISARCPTSTRHPARADLAEAFHYRGVANHKTNATTARSLTQPGHQAQSEQYERAVGRGHVDISRAVSSIRRSRTMTLDRSRTYTGALLNRGSPSISARADFRQALADYDRAIQMRPNYAKRSSIAAARPSRWENSTMRSRFRRAIALKTDSSMLLQPRRCL